MPKERHTPFWALALALPFLSLLALIYDASQLPHQNGDWFGARFLLLLFRWTLVGCLATILSSVASFLLREKRKAWSLWSAIPAGSLLLFTLVWRTGRL